MPLEQVQLRPIGYVQTPYTSLAETPIQTSRNPDEAWEADGRGTRPFVGDRLRPVPFLLQDTGQRVGVFATRAPVRPNYLALSLVRVVAVRGNQVDFTGVDLLDRTPVLDIKPFAPHLDVPGYTRESGWLAHIRSGWYSQPDAATNPLVSPGREGLRGMGLEPGPPPRPPTGRSAPRP